jgi:hypothetical protein
MKRLWQWLGTNHQSIQALAAILAGILAVGTVIGVKWQIDAAARLQKEQSARDIYREYLNISMAKPEFADPDYCKISASSQFAAYESYMAYLLYTAEQVFALGEGWDTVMGAEMESHAGYLCSADYRSDDYDPKVRALAEGIRAKQCPAIKPCAE